MTWAIYLTAAAILLACGYYGAGILIEHPGRHEKPRDAAPLDPEDQATIGFLRELHGELPWECCPRCERTDPREPCQGCYCHEDYPAADDTVTDLKPPAWVREHLDGCETVGQYFDRVMARSRRG